jgi:CRISPR-associated protein Csb2
MPTDSKPTLVLDARAVVHPDHSPLLVHWPVDLAPAESELFEKLAARLGYLGRAESWTECEAVPSPSVVPSVATGWTVPHEGDAPVPPGCDQVALIAPVTETAYADWFRALARSKTRRSTPAPTLFDALHVETSWIQKNGWSAPPGSRLVIYDRPSASAISPLPPPTRRARPQVASVPLVLLSLSSSARSRSPMPLRERVLPQAELLHRTIASKLGRLPDLVDTRAELIGLDAAGKPITGHGHAHILPLTLLATDNHLDHVLVWAPGGLSAASQEILRSLRKTYMKGGVGEVEVRFAGSGSLEQFKAVPALRHVLGEARVWESHTPFVPPRHLKKRGRNTLEGQVTEELCSRGFPVPDRIELLHQESIGFRHFVRVRRNGARPAQDLGCAVRLTFPVPVNGPVALGYASHFGLGLFAAVY